MNGTDHNGMSQTEQAEQSTTHRGGDQGSEILRPMGTKFFTNEEGSYK